MVPIIVFDHEIVSYCVPVSAFPLPDGQGLAAEALLHPSMCRVAARLREEGVDTRIVLIDGRGSGCLCATLKTPTVQVRGGL